MPVNHSPEAWIIGKPVVCGRNGLVGSQDLRASEVGAAVLREGGNAVDAAVATSFAIAVLEPWMSGLGGGCFMLIQPAGQNQAVCIDAGMVAPRRLNPSDYPLTGGTGGDLFGWPAVVEDRNLLGYPAFAVPGQVAGLALALASFGTRSWAESLGPAIELAEQGLIADWYATLKISSAARQLRRFDESRRIYLPDGLPPAAEWSGAAPRLDLGALPRTLRRLAETGPEDFYHGELARLLAADIAAGGGCLRTDDLQAYRAEQQPAGYCRYRDSSVSFAPGLSAGPSLQRALTLLSERWQAARTTPDEDAYAAYAAALQEAYAERFAAMGYGADPGCTTHINVIDRHGNRVSLTQTLLSVFGAKVVLPETGILMNNGVMWFDPRPGGPNAIAPGKRPLANMCPVLLERGDGLQAALGASGGRRIMPAVAQLLSFLVDYRMDLEQAFQQPRIDASGGDFITLDQRLDPSVRTRLSRQFAVQIATHGVYPNLFACPNALIRQQGEQQGAAFIPSPRAGVASAD